MARRSIGRLALVSFAVLLCVLLLALVVVRQVLVASLPQLSGTRILPGLSAPVRVERDGLGIPTLRGANRLDVARATGFLHAQERFFEMDVARRFAAGELSELVGAAAVSTDRGNRLHRLRAVAREVLARGEPDARALLRAYAAGVNAGLAALGARPPEYLLLRTQPAPWLPEDSVLVLGAMFGNDLANSHRELELQAMYEALPAPAVDFLRPLGDEWDAPMVGGPITPPPMPGPEIFDLRNPPPAFARASAGKKAESHSATPLRAANAEIEPGSIDGFAIGEIGPGPDYGSGGGSNAWAISGAHSADGRAIVANDPHLPLQVPNVWYRISFAWQDERGIGHRVTGASLPGLPFVGIGSNGHVAWGFTVAFDDRSDMIIVEPGEQDGTYRTPDGPKRFEHTVERLKVKGDVDVLFGVTSTIWGPIVGRDPDGHPLAQDWQAHHPDGTNLTFTQIEYATTVEQALDITNRSGLPSYNFLVADDRGSIGWTVTGRLPKRVGFDGRVPTSWADGSRRWDGWLDPADYPRVVNPASGRVWSSNNRPVDRPLLDRLGLEGYIMGPRARQVRDDLMARDRSTPADSLRVQLDDRALFLDRWRAFLLEEMKDQAAPHAPERGEFRRLVETSWDGRASVPSVGFLLVERFRYELARRVIGAMLPAPIAERAFRPASLIEWWESALWRLVHDRPPHLLAREWKNWSAVINAAIDATIASATANGRPLTSANWGSTTGTVAHPLSRAVPWLARWLDMPYTERPGDSNVPRVRFETSAGEVSATLRMAVSPGHEQTGIFHMPGGESGHPLSPHYADMEQSWVEGRATPFLPGPTVHTLTLQPRQAK